MNYAERTACPRKGCKGALFNVSSRLGMALGVMTLRCDQCGRVVSIKVEG